jgi:ABC-type dipeptide/oligopeptide/nickel transport system ATPase subunit
MKLFNCILSNIQHIEELKFNIDLSDNKLMCIVGKNGVGKTTLIRAIKNLQSADTFTKTASPYIFNNTSHIKYTIDEVEYDFKYISKLQVIDTKSIIDDEIKNSIYVELPIPHGERFNLFQRLSEIDEELRKNISLGKYKKPNELISFLSNVYNSNRFDNLKEISIKKAKYYFILKEDNFYIREDYLSSGEFFVINLYKMIQRKSKLIVIDEIDISLDASAQVNLINELRDFCTEYQVNIVFTTHSLALMKTLSGSELHYMENNKAVVTVRNTSYNYVKSVLFGFRGWDKYILTEDEVLEEYLTHLISQDDNSVFFEYKIIYIAGGTNVVSLMNRNSDEEFFSSPENVISVLDGDQYGDEARLQYCQNNEMIFFIPFQSVEKQLKEHYDKEGQDGLPLVIFNNEGTDKKVRKRLYSSLVNKMSKAKVFSFINDKKPEEVEIFRTKLIDFLKL